MMKRLKKIGIVLPKLNLFFYESLNYKLQVIFYRIQKYQLTSEIFYIFVKSS